jgi:hypothetical protein
MPRWYDVVGAGITWLGRLYGVVFLCLGVVFLYWGGRGLLAFKNGIRAAWSDPAVCAVGLLIGVLSLWVGSHLVRNAVLAREFAGGRGLPDELAQTLDEVGRLEKTNPGVARDTLDNYFVRDAATTERRRAELRQRSSYDVEAAIALRRELQKEIELNALFRKDVLKKWPEEQRAPMLAEINHTNRQFESELLELDRAITRLRLS